MDQTTLCTAPWVNSTYVTVIDISQIESLEYPLQIRLSEVNDEN